MALHALQALRARRIRLGLIVYSLEMMHARTVAGFAHSTGAVSVAVHVCRDCACPPCVCVCVTIGACFFEDSFTM